METGGSGATLKGYIMSKSLERIGLVAGSTIVSRVLGLMRDMLTEYSEQDPSVIFSIIKSADSLHGLASLVGDKKSHRGNKEIKPCQNCGDPCNSDLCSSCIIVEQLNSNS